MSLPVVPREIIQTHQPTFLSSGEIAASACVVIPTLNEPAPLLIGLLSEISNYCPGIRLIVVDDSNPEHARDFEHLITNAVADAVVLLRGGTAEHQGGLAGAVMTGLHRAREAGCDYAVVMDSDGQHPPTMLVELLETLVGGAGRDVVVASRYRAGGSVGSGLSPFRRLVSVGSAALAHGMFPIAIKSCSDPMSGFFAVRLSAIDEDIWVDGFKVLLQIMAQHPHLRLAETGFDFQQRRDGASKASASEGMRYLRGLATLKRKTIKQSLSRRTPTAYGRTVRERPPSPVIVTGKSMS